jgi:RNase adapter protein RapZ
VSHCPLIIISGRSGSGKSTALHLLEDEGFYCIDNLPLGLLENLLQEIEQAHFAHYRGVAVCVDSRNAWTNMGDLAPVLMSIPERTHGTILYLDALDPILITRYSETRRKHPLSNTKTTLSDAIGKERELLEPILELASIVVDTSDMTIYELRDTLRQRLLGAEKGELSLLFQSFGFKKGIPSDADLVFDVRMLPNPHWVKELRLLNGTDDAVIEFLGQQPLTDALYQDIQQFVEKWLPSYGQSNRSYVTIAIGCTGGQHRSVYMARRLYLHFSQRMNNTHIRHRELSSKEE